MPGSRMPEGLELARMWHGVMGHLQLEVPGTTFSTWMEGTRPVRVEEDTLYVEARSAFTCDSLNEHPLRTMVVRALRATTDDPGDVRFLPPGGTAGAPVRVLSPDGGSPARVIGTLNRRFTFDRYVTSERNVLALQACRDVADTPESAVSPVIVYGQPGLGKTHLLHAVGSTAAAAGRATACLSAEEFANRYGAAVREKDVGAFQDEMRDLRLLLIDDLQYLEGRNGTQVELVHTIDTITNGGGHVVVASEQDPRRLRLLPRLISRLAGGLFTVVGAPAADERRCFVEHLARQQRTSLPGWAIERLAALPAPSIRVIQGTVNAAIALQRTDRLSLSALDADVLANAVCESSDKLDAAAVLDTVATAYRVSVAEMAGRSRKPVLTEARAVAVAALRGHGVTFTDIGNRLGARSTATLKDLNKRGAKLIAQRPDLRDLIAS